MRTRTPLALVATWALVSIVPAQDTKKILDDAFAKLDTNGDGAVERSEFPGSDEQFLALLPGPDKQVTRDEFERSALARRLIAAANGDASLPRPRVDTDLLRVQRIDAALRHDRNRDGKVTRTEWPGDDIAFAELDLDTDGDIDRADRTEARRRTPEVVSTELPVFKSALEEPARLLERLDRNRDGALQESEVRGNRIAPAFAWADRDRDGNLIETELARLVGAVATMVQARDRGDSRPSAYRVPFSTWDKDHDGRIETAEWQGPKYLFPRIDQDRDAAVTEGEVERYVRSVEGATFVERFDLNDDGRVTEGEFGGSPEAFRRADRNGDGVVSNADR